MLAFLWKKMWKNKWMMTGLLLGNILLMGIASGVPLYSQAIMQRMLTQQLAQFQDNNGVYPGLLDIQISIAGQNGATAAQQYEAGRSAIIDRLPARYGVQALSSKSTITLPSLNILPQDASAGNPSPINLKLSGMSDFPRHITIASGRMSAHRDDGVIETVISQNTYDYWNLLLNTVYVSQTKGADGQPLKFVITGVFNGDGADDPYWTAAQDSFGVNLDTWAMFMDYDEAKGLFIDNFSDRFPVSAVFTVSLDCSGFSARDADRYLAVTASLHGQYETSKYVHNVTESLTGIFTAYRPESQKLDLSLWVLQVPIFIMIILFIFMVTGRILSLDRTDISVMKSRGAGRPKIVLMYFLQGVFVCLLSCAAGLGLGFMICRIIGASDGFLNMVSRAGLHITLNPQAFLFMGAAAAVSLATMVLPVLGYSKVGIVDLKAERSARKKSVWQMFFLDILALLVSLYGLYQFNARKEVILQTGAALHSVDPLMFLTSSLFVAGLGLFCLRVFPIVAGLIFRVFERRVSAPMYASLLRVTRAAGGERFIMIFLILTLAAGIFNANVARTINRNMDDQINYTVGADVRFQQQWAGNAAAAPSDGSAAAPVMYYEPDFERIAQLPGVVSAAKVYVGQPAFTDSNGNKFANVTLMGIISDQFGRTAWFRNGLLPLHINDYLNVMAMNPRGVLLSSNLKGYYAIGGQIRYAIGQSYATGVVYGFVDYWPGYSRFTRDASVGSDVENYLIVANLSYLQSRWGVMPYQVWLKTDTATNNFLINFAGANNIVFTLYADAKAQIVSSRNDPLLQGTNGALTVDFIISLIVCAAGFLIYWILTIRERVLQFGVFRAMGLPMRGIVRILAYEQILISGVAIVLGVAIGAVSSRLFVPVIQIAYSASQQSLPLVIITEAADYIRLLAFIGVVIVICLGILAFIASKIKIAAALKLGAD